MADDTYPARPYDEAKADPADIAKLEDRQPDEIADYEEKVKNLPSRESDEAEAEEPEAVQDNVQGKHTAQDQPEGTAEVS